jgi:hypothetical protein
MRFLFAVLCLMASLSSHAVSVTWTVNNAVFDDGATIIGQFDYDDATAFYSNVMLSTSSGSFFATPAEYGTAGLWNAEEVYFSEIGGSESRVLALRFEQALTSAGGTLSLDAFEGVTVPDVRSLLAGGTVTAVPIPAAVWLFGSALAGLGWMHRKQTV